MQENTVAKTYPLMSLAMSLPFLQRSHAYAAHLLHRAGLSVSQIPTAVDVARSTVETWYNREIASGNNQQALMVLKGQVKEKAPHFLYEQVKELVLVKLIIHLGIRSALASNIVTLILPFILKRVYEQVRQNSKVQTWWHDQSWKQHVPSSEKVKVKLKDLKDSLRQTKTQKDHPLFI